MHSKAVGKIHSDLRIGADISSTVPLNANSEIAGTGLILGSRGFVLTKEEAEIMVNHQPSNRPLIFPLKTGKDVVDRARNVFVIDTNGWSDEELKQQSPAIYQHLLDNVYPQRQTNRDPKLRKYWWLFRRSSEQIRNAISDLSRYIVIPETSKHRIFSFEDYTIKPEHGLVVIATDDGYLLGVLSSRPHDKWALAAGGTLGSTPRYNKTRCFETFPFPDATEEQKATIRNIAEELDAHRKRQQAQQPKLTLTDMYNVLEKLRAGESLTAKEQTTHTQGLVSVLNQLHDELDAAVFAAYGWDTSLSDEEILEKLVALNAERAAEEANGFVRWLRPDYQAPEEVASQTQLIAVADAPTPVAPVEKQAWPKSLAAQAQAVRAALVALAAPATVGDVAGVFKGSKTKKRLATIGELLEMLGALGQVVEARDGMFALV